MVLNCGHVLCKPYLQNLAYSACLQCRTAIITSVHIQIINSFYNSIRGKTWWTNLIRKPWVWRHDGYCTREGISWTTCAILHRRLRKAVSFKCDECITVFSIGLCLTMSFLIGKSRPAQNPIVKKKTMCYSYCRVFLVYLYLISIIFCVTVLIVGNVFMSNGFWMRCWSIIPVVFLLSF
jgi:hypothetical protein